MKITNYISTIIINEEKIRAFDEISKVLKKLHDGKYLSNETALNEIDAIWTDAFKKIFDSINDL